LIQKRPAWRQTGKQKKSSPTDASTRLLADLRPTHGACLARPSTASRLRQIAFWTGFRADLTLIFALGNPQKVPIKMVLPFKNLILFIKNLSRNQNFSFKNLITLLAMSV
jgi:hypothetical protein